MIAPLPLPPKKFQKRGPKIRAVKPLTLVAATYQAGTYLTLTFDRPIDASGVVAAAIVVDDAPDMIQKFRPNGTITMLAPNVVRFGLIDFESSTGSGITLTATAGNGIRAMDDGGTWTGVTGVALPYAS